MNALVTPVTVADLVREGVVHTLHGAADVVLAGVRHDSREVGPGDLFVAMPGTNADGTRFAAAAVERGAAAVLAERRLELDVPVLVADDARLALSKAAAVVYRHPTLALDVVGITGTNGKTTCSALLEAVVAAAGYAPAVMGTTSFRAPGIEEPATHTTPEGDAIARFARRAVDAGASHLLMEISSHGLALRRADAVRYRVAAFTNLTQDHLDFHGDIEAYGAAKARLFTELSPGTSVINVDDAFGAELAERLVGPTLRCSVRAATDVEVRVSRSELGRDGISATITTPDGELDIASPLIGAHNVENLAVVVGCAHALGIDGATTAGALAAATGAPGRLERVEDPRDVAVFVDYAHTPDALSRSLAALREITPGRLFVVFGCGGDRDRSKRPKMGRAAAEGADVLVVTSDNPRTEDPLAILREIEPGVTAGGQPPVEAFDGVTRGYRVVEDRRQALTAALTAATSGDTVLIAGKGHEDYQIIGTEKFPFDDRVEARAAIARLGGGR